MEIFIIGGGISGLFCGINLAESGIDVKIIEKKEEIGKPLKCAEGVSENGIEILGDREIIESVKKKEIKGSVMILPNGKKIYFIKKGFLIDREKLEKLLEMKFLKNGGKIIRDKVERIEGNKIFGLKKIYKGDLIVIASGTNFIKGIEYPYKGFLFATEKRIKSNEENEFLKFYYGEIYKPIYMWKFYHGDYFGIGKTYRDKKEFEIIKNFLNERDVFKTITGKLPFPLNPPKFLYKDKKFFIGDAGAFVNQLTFAGIHGALLSGVLCAERIKEFLKNKNYNELEKFNENLKILFLKKFKPSIKTNIICILLEEHSYLISEINENGVHILDKFEETLVGKEDPLLHSKKTMEVFHKAATSLIKIFNEKRKKYDIAIFGPSIFIQDFLKILRKENPKLSNFIKKTAYVSSSDTSGIEEILRNRLLIEYGEDIPLLKGVDIMEKILEKMAKGESIFSIGLNEVILSLRQGAAEKILISENFLWNNLEKNELDEILDLSFKTKAELLIIPNNIEAGEKLESFGGIISLNRWPLSL